jgi:hypothetical protein
LACQAKALVLIKGYTSFSYAYSLFSHGVGMTEVSKTGWIDASDVYKSKDTHKVAAAVPIVHKKNLVYVDVDTRRYQ